MFPTLRSICTSGWIERLLLQGVEMQNSPPQPYALRYKGKPVIHFKSEGHLVSWFASFATPEDAAADVKQAAEALAADELAKLEAEVAATVHKGQKAK